MDASEPLLSVVICTWNRAAALGAAVSSVLGQTFAGFELVVVDDGSTDDTAAVVASCRDARVRYVHQENHGLSVARNTGVATARGTYVAFLDDDDLAYPTWLEQLVRALHSRGDGDVAVVCCGEVLADDERRVVRTMLPGPLGPAFEGYSGWFIPGSFLVRRDLYESVGGFVPGLEHMHHTEFALRLLPECRARGLQVVTVGEALVERHTGGSRRIGTANLGRVRRGMEYVLAHHAEQLQRDPWVLAQYSAVAGVAAAQTGDFRAARRHLSRAVRTRPTDTKHWARLGLAFVPVVGRRYWGRQVAASPVALD